MRHDAQERLALFHDLEDLGRVDGRGLDDVSVDVPKERHRIEHRRQQGGDFAAPASGQQRDLQRVAGRTPVALDAGQLVDQRMPDVRHRHCVLPIEVFLERQDDDHPVDVLGDLLHPPPPPRPYLRRDVVDHAQPQLAAAPRQP